MTIIEAIKSGKRFKRKKDSFGIWIEAVMSDGNYFKGSSSLGLLPCEILADDWEIEEEKINLTKAQVIQSFIIAAKENFKDKYKDPDREFMQLFLENLGFKS